MKIVFFILLLLLSSFRPAWANGLGVLPTPASVSVSERMIPTPPKIAVRMSLSRGVAPDSATVRLIAGCRVEIVGLGDAVATLASESYRLRLDSCEAFIEAADYRGAVYALQTLGSILGSDSVPAAVTVSDAPRCNWRAFMLDSGRQFHSPETIKKYLRMASMLKFNRFHWHLTEGLGWRPEIAALPRLAEVGGYVAKGPEQQGHYSQKDIKEIVDYAARLGIDIVPEIDIPGHSEAALNAYPSLGCRGVAPKIPEEGFTPDIFCAGNDSTIVALKQILDEVCRIFPGEYIHLGGDEAPKDNWDACPRCRERIRREGLADSHDLQLWLSAEMARYVGEKGRKAIFWDDVVNGGGTVRLPENAVVQWWNYRGRKDQAVDSARAAGLPLIASPNYYCYLNFPTEPWRGYGPERTVGFEDAYLRNPADSAITADRDGRILGMTAALWTDYGLTEDMLDERLFPRIFALAELMWHTGARKPLDTLLNEASAASARFLRNESIPKDGK